MKKAAVPLLLLALFLVVLVLYFMGWTGLFPLVIVSGIFAAVALLFLRNEE